MTETKARSPAKKMAIIKTSSTEKKPAKNKNVAEPKINNSAKIKKTVTPAADKKSPARKTAIPAGKPPSTRKTKTKQLPTAEERYRMVETAAYYIAERNGFQGDSVAHWAAAELEIAARMKNL